VFARLAAQRAPCCVCGVCAVPDHLAAIIHATQLGNLEEVKRLWRPEMVVEFSLLKREDTCHPLLNATHHLRPDVVKFFCDMVRALACVAAPSSRPLAPAFALRQR
jgi:hypothetical protein